MICKHLGSQKPGKAEKKFFFFYSAQYISLFSLPLFQKTYTKCKHVYFKIFFDFFLILDGETFRGGELR